MRSSTFNADHSSEISLASWAADSASFRDVSVLSICKDWNFLIRSSMLLNIFTMESSLTEECLGVPRGASVLVYLELSISSSSTVNFCRSSSSTVLRLGNKTFFPSKYPLISSNLANAGSWLLRPSIILSRRGSRIGTASSSFLRIGIVEIGRRRRRVEMASLRLLEIKGEKLSKESRGRLLTWKVVTTSSSFFIFLLGHGITIHPSNLWFLQVTLVHPRIYNSLILNFCNNIFEVFPSFLFWFSFIFLAAKHGKDPFGMDSRKHFCLKSILKKKIGV